MKHRSYKAGREKWKVLHRVGCAWSCDTPLLLLLQSMPGAQGVLPYQGPWTPHSAGQCRPCQLLADSSCLLNFSSVRSIPLCPSISFLNSNLLWPSLLATWLPPKDIPCPASSCPHPTYLKTRKEGKPPPGPPLLLQWFTSCRSIQTSLATLRPSATPWLRREATHPLLLSLFISWRCQLAGLRGFLHPLVNSVTFNVRAKAGLSALLFPLLNSFPSSSSATISHGHTLNLAITGDCTTSSPNTNQEGTLFPLPLFPDHLLYIANTHSSSLDILSISTTPLVPSLTAPHSAFTFLSRWLQYFNHSSSLSYKWPPLPHLPLSISYLLAKLQHWWNPTLRHTISEYPSSHWAGEHCGMGRKSHNQADKLQFKFMSTKFQWEERKEGREGGRKNKKEKKASQSILLTKPKRFSCQTHFLDWLSYQFSLFRLHTWSQ